MYVYIHVCVRVCMCVHIVKTILIMSKQISGVHDNIYLTTKIPRKILPFCVYYILIFVFFNSTVYSLLCASICKYITSFYRDDFPASSVHSLVDHSDEVQFMCIWRVVLQLCFRFGLYNSPMTATGLHQVVKMAKSSYGTLQ